MHEQKFFLSQSDTAEVNWKMLTCAGFELSPSGYRFAALPVELSSPQGLEASFSPNFSPLSLLDLHFSLCSNTVSSLNFLYTRKGMDSTILREFSPYSQSFWSLSIKKFYLIPSFRLVSCSVSPTMALGLTFVGLTGRLEDLRWPQQRFWEIRDFPIPEK